MPRARKPKPSPPADGLPKVIAGIAIFGGIDGTGEPDPVQARMDAAVAEHNERQRRALEEVLARGRAKR